MVRRWAPPPCICSGNSFVGKASLRILADQFQILAAVTFAGLVRDCAAMAIRAAANMLAFQSDDLCRLPTSALARVACAALSAALSAASAENSCAFLYCQNMHLNQLRNALACARLVGDKIAFAVVFAVSDIINLTLVSRDNHAYNRK